MIQRMLLISFLFVFNFSENIFAGDAGKIRGRIFDAQSGEALVGANVMVEGSSWGDASDIEGRYVILNVPTGTYTVRATLLGYQTIAISNVKVSSDLSTDLDFKLTASAIELGAVEIVRESPLVNKNKTNTVAIITSDVLKQMPIRSVTQVFALSSGVVSQGGDYYVRGGRAEETAYYVDGVLVNNPINGRMTMNVISNAIEEVQSQIGGMTAEYGNAMSGVVNTSTKTGSQNYNFGMEILTDDFGVADSKRLGAYSYGQNEYTMTIGGPIIPGEPKYRFFLAGQRMFNRSGASFIEGIKFPCFDSLKITGADFIVTNRDTIEGGVSSMPTGSTGNRSYLANLLNQIDFAGGRRIGGISRDSWGLNGNLFFDLGEFNLKAGGSYNFNTNVSDVGQSLDAIRIVANDTRFTKTTSTDATGFLKFTHILSPSSFYTINLSKYHYDDAAGDPVWFDNIENYGNPNLKENSVLVGPSRNPASFSYMSFSHNWPGVITNSFSKRERSNLGARLDFINQIDKTWEIRLGGELTQYTIRTYSINARDIYAYRMRYPTKNDWFIYNNARVSFYGYDILGNKFEGGKQTYTKGDDVTTVDLSPDGPKQPLFTGLYLQNKFEFDDLIMNIGARLDILSPGGKKYRDPKSIKIDDVSGTYVVSNESLIDQETFKQVSPRFGFSFPVTDRTIFHATYGKFIQYGRLADLYDARTTSGFYFQGGYARQFPNPNLKPERTTSYEVGFQQQYGEIASTDITFYYKDIRDLHVIRVVFPGQNSDTKSYFTSINGDFGTSKGFSFNLNLRRINRLSVRATYTFANATSTGSSSNSHFNIAWQDNSFNNEPYFPVIPAPTDFDRTHTGNINLDYRFLEQDGPSLFGIQILENVGFNLLASFSSGIRYTRSQIDGAFSFSSANAPLAYENLNNSVGPWITNVDLKIDKSVKLMNMVELNLYMTVENLLNRKNIYTVYSGTGLPNNDGWFTTETGKTWGENNGAKGVELYNYLQNSPSNYSAPRVVRLGLQLNY